ncbi:P-II family nitrogen regulator [Murimonas intestini]|uniref:Nitrogen regulatory protein P-II family n=1 Tax=Murimonas intestini TaxID=1337051 RepID=A0AB73SZX7_9FIRM|nr:P-II family nitrogen regulator [Murimonas intestini]MCR1843192.1 P-II family nitrogen regulator [Murimonas intestini]MCR1868579.1 P-II family nitrogen regulator [Murimonas intestini]MCR1885148.1 P-II family nitrogen regulator [Murimonas intestini]
MKKLEMIIQPGKLEELKAILDECQASGVMISNIMGYGNQKGYRRLYRGTEYNVNLLPKVRVETVVDDDVSEKIIDRVVKEINTGNYGDGKIFIYEVQDAVRIRTGERGKDAL